MKSRSGVKAALTAMSPRTQRPRAWARRVCVSHSSSRRVSMRWWQGRRSALNVAWTQRYVFALASLLGNTDTDCLVIALHALWKILLVEGTASFRISLERKKNVGGVLQAGAGCGHVLFFLFIFLSSLLAWPTFNVYRKRNSDVEYRNATFVGARVRDIRDFAHRDDDVWGGENSCSYIDTRLE